MAPVRRLRARLAFRPLREGSRHGLSSGEGLVEFLLPFQIPYVVIRDIIAVVIYAFGLVGLIALWSIWQKRGAVAETTVEKSTFGRPLVREGAKL